MTVALLVAGAVFFFVLGMGSRIQAEKELRQRVEEYHVQQGSVSRHLQEPFAQRVLQPLRKWMKNRFAFMLPGEKRERWQKSLWQAGFVTALPSDLLAAKLLLGTMAGALPLIAYLVSVYPLSQMMQLAAVCAATGYLLPDLVIAAKISARKKALVKELPDSLDLLTISVEAGLGFDTALSRVVEKGSGVLAAEFAYMLRELQMGQSRKKAWRSLALRTGTEDINTFVSAVIQAEQLGVGLTGVLRAQSSQMRLKRRQRVEEQAMKAPIKMLLPLVFFIFPTMFIVLLGPAVIQIVRVVGK